ncbi:MAG: cation transporter [Bdellovibrionales bacterium]|nr:cation transporter [Bdellovibrionales bacterium]
MRARELPSYSDENDHLLLKAKRLEYMSLFVRVVIVTLIYFVMGNSQTMKTAWIEDLLGMVPACAFLIALRQSSKEPDETYPFGRLRATNISFLCAAVALFLFGAFLLVDAIWKLAIREHPTIGSVELLGFEFWQGWLMMAALIISTIPLMILGKLKTPLAKKLNEGTLFADGEMDRADWLTGLTGVVGMLFVAFGIWWGDALAAAFISFDILRDGLKNLKHSVAALMDRSPRLVGEAQEDPLVRQLVFKAEQIPWVRKAEARLREEGSLISGEIFCFTDTPDIRLIELEKAQKLLATESWRVYDVAIQPMSIKEY